MSTETADSPDPSATTENLIECRDVTHEYVRTQRPSLLPWRENESQARTTALTDVSMAVSRGETVGLAGPSGSGKSTLLHLIAGLILPKTGKITVCGTDMTELSSSKRTAMRHRHIGLVFQRFHLLPSLSARANVALPLVETGVRRSKRRKRARKLLERVDLGDRIHHTPSQLSGGEQQRVAIARALVTDPAVILADEPTGELDTETGQTVLQCLTELAGDQALVLASHDEDALAVADRVCHMLDGRFVDTANAT